MASNAISNFQKLSTKKAANGGDPIVMVTAYDAPTMRYAVKGEVDIVLVGDSASMVMLGNESTMDMSKEEMLILVKAVSKANEDIPIIADMVWGSYHVNIEKSVEHAIELVKAGAHAVKVEGGRQRVEVIKAIINAEIPVVGHIGLTPQSLLGLGGYKVQGKDLEQAQEVMQDAKALEQAGISMLVVECIPDALSRTITEEIDVPVIGIGAGRHVDGQVLVMHDLLGITGSTNYMKPKFVRHYAEIENIAVDAVKSYVQDVKTQHFPSSAETYHMADGVVEELKNASKQGTPLEQKQ